MPYHMQNSKPVVIWTNPFEDYFATSVTNKDENIASNQCQMLLYNVDKVVDIRPESQRLLILCLLYLGPIVTYFGKRLHDQPTFLGRLILKSSQVYLHACFLQQLLDCGNTITQVHNPEKSDRFGAIFMIFRVIKGTFLETAS